MGTWLWTLCAVVAAAADTHRGVYSPSTQFLVTIRNGRAIDGGGGCWAESRWWVSGARVSVRDPCLRCHCGAGALRCTRTTCAASPAVPHRCHLRRRQNTCCPEIHCPDGVTTLEQSNVARLDDDEFSEPDGVASLAHVCVEDGTVYAAGSALGAHAACEACFCLRGRRRCLRPRCLPPPPGCRARPTSGACCPQRYYCDPPNFINSTNSRPHQTHHSIHECKINDDWYPEGQRVHAGEHDNCTRCFCMRGALRCQPLACAPPLLGCEPRLRDGDCCPHRYHCPHGHDEISIVPIQDNTLTVTRNDERSFNPLNKLKSTTTHLPTLAVSASGVTPVSPAAASEGPVVPKVKRKTDDPPPSTVTPSSEVVTESRTTAVAQPESPRPSLSAATTARPELPANGTVNCSTELASDIITESAPLDADSFVVNVTSSLRTNTSRPATPADLLADNKTKQDYDYDYVAPTLPPSLPNLKIIPFVAADAVVEGKEVVKETPSYVISDREDKFPVYYGPAEPATSQHPGPKLPTPPAVILSSTTPTVTADFVVKTPAVNLFSPPIETEGGFVPKGPGPIVADEYYAVYPSTRAPPALPHLTTSMQLDTGDGDCTASDGRRVAEGASVRVGCSRCACARGRLGCAALPCASDTLCDAQDSCCHHVPCIPHNTTQPLAAPSPHPTQTPQVLLGNEINTKAPLEILSEIIPFDPPADRREPPTTASTYVSSVSTPASNLTSGKTFDKVKESSKENKANMTGQTTITLTTLVPKLNQTTTISSPLTTTTTVPVTVPIATTTTGPAIHAAPVSPAASDSHEYSEEEEEEDEGFSFGSVLKLLLSEGYDATSAPPPLRSTPRLPPTTARPPPRTTAAPTPAPTTNRPALKPSVPTAVPFIPMPHRPYIPPKKVFSQSTVNRIDHLVLGEATAIKKSTAKPSTAGARPATPPSRPAPALVPVPSAAVPPSPSPAAGGLLKLAGCNIYGRMYRVGWIITELSTPCQECRCTELGVQCSALPC